MTLRITKAADPIEVTRIILCLYGQPGVGKTTVAFSADGVLLLDFDRGAHRSANRGDAVLVQSWADVTTISADDLAPYRTVVVDTVGRALDVLTADIIKRDPKAGRGGALSIQGYGKLKGEFVSWLRLLTGQGKDVVLIAHMDEQRSGDEVLERLDVAGGSKGEIYKASDAMGRIAVRSGVRMLSFDPTDAAFGKNPGQLEPLAVPHPEKDPAFLAGVIAQIKARLNAMTAAQTEARTLLTEIDAAAGVDDLNVLLARVKGRPDTVRRHLAERAKYVGCEFDRDSGAFVELEDAEIPDDDVEITDGQPGLALTGARR